MLPEPNSREVSVAKSNYSFEKRQRELAKKKKKEEKAERKRAKSSTPDAASGELSFDAPTTADADVSSGKP